MNRTLGIDHGEARIGLALSDELGMLAHPLETVAARDVDAAIERIAAVVADNDVDLIVLGLPLRMDGSKGTAVKKVHAFRDALAAALPKDISIEECDERLTTVSAWEKLHQAGRTEKNSRDIIDQAAAVEILQEYLDAQGSAAGPLAGDDDDDDDDDEDMTGFGYDKEGDDNDDEDGFGDD